MRTITYHALRRIDRRIEEILVTRYPFSANNNTETTKHVAFYPDTRDGEKSAVRSMQKANRV